MISIYDHFKFTTLIKSTLDKDKFTVFQSLKNDIFYNPMMQFKIIQ